MLRDYMKHFVPDETYLNLIAKGQMMQILRELYSPGGN